MADPFLECRPRRLPVFFVLDTSSAMVGTLEVTMQQGLSVVKYELRKHTVASHYTHLAVITFGETATFYGLTLLDFFTPPLWQAQGQCFLKPALVYLEEAFTFDLIVTQADRPGDYAPLVFLILSDRPTDSWQEAYQALVAFTDNRRPLIVTLVTRSELVKEMKGVGHAMLLLQPAEGASMTNFFFWVARAIAKVCEDCEREATKIDFPALPYGVVVPN